MKIFYLLAMFLSVLFSKGQILIDSISETGPFLQTNIFPATEGSPENIYVGHQDDLSGSFMLLRYDDSLTLLDTLTGVDIGKSGARFSYPFSFNNSLYYICRDSSRTQRNFSIHKLENGKFTDSFNLNLDSIANGYPSMVTVINDSLIQILVELYLPSGIFKGSGILHLDSSFNFISYHHPPLDSIAPTWATKRISAVYQLNDSTWHLFYTNDLAVYNPKLDTILMVKPLISNIYNTYQLPSKTYMALGLTQKAIVNSASSLGFYIIDHQTNILDTVSFNAFKDTIPQWGINNYSDENVSNNTRNSIVYDNNNIYLTCRGSYSPKTFTAPPIAYFYVVKTDLKGSMKWQFIWGGQNSSVILTGIAPTSDKGCIISGSIIRSGQPRNAVLIKVGPDGNISNVEVDAPENLVAFYPNPVKDKLHFDYLPEANGTYTLQVVEMNGKPVFEVPLDEENGFIAIPLKTGFYLYQLKDETGKVMQVGKLVAE